MDDTTRNEIIGGALATIPEHILDSFIGVTGEIEETALEVGLVGMSLRNTGKLAGFAVGNNTSGAITDVWATVERTGLSNVVHIQNGGIVPDGMVGRDAAQTMACALILAHEQAAAGEHF